MKPCILYNKQPWYRGRVVGNECRESGFKSGGSLGILKFVRIRFCNWLNKPCMNSVKCVCFIPTKKQRKIFHNILTLDSNRVPF